MEKKIFYLTLLMAVLFAGLALGLANSVVMANDEEDGDTEVEDVNDVAFTEVSSRVGKFGLIGTVTAVNAAEKTIAVNGVKVDVSEARIVGWRWWKFAEEKWESRKEWWKEWTVEELKVGDKVRVGGRIKDGKLIARLVVLQAFRFVEPSARTCTVDADCAHLLPSSLKGKKFEAKCKESKCKLVKIEGIGDTTTQAVTGEATTTLTPPITAEQEGGTTIRKGIQAGRLQEIQDKLKEILNKIQELQSKIGTMVGGGALIEE